jgi:hypothetical protein
MHQQPGQSASIVYPKVVRATDERDVCLGRTAIAKMPKDREGSNVKTPLDGMGVRVRLPRFGCLPRYRDRFDRLSAVSLIVLY